MKRSVYFRVDPRFTGSEQQWSHWINLWENVFQQDRMEVEFLTFDHARSEGQSKCDQFFARKKKDTSASFLINLTFPEYFYRVEGVACGGLFLGSCESLPSEWYKKFREMDFIIAFSQWNEDAVKRRLSEKNVFTIPFPVAKEGQGIPSSPLLLHDADLAILKGDYRYSIVDPPRSFEGNPLFFAETRLSPQDGFPVLLSEWFLYKKKGGAGNVIISITPKGNSARKDAKICDLVDSIFRLMRRNRLSHSGIYLLLDGLSGGQKTSLFSIVDAMISVSHEGGLISENTFDLLEMGKPIIVPNHSDVADILPSDYSLTVPWRSENCSFDDSENLVPVTARWFVVEEGGLVDALDRFCSMTEETKKGLACGVRKNILTRYSESTILGKIASFVRALS